MDNGDGATVSTVFLQCRMPLLTSTMAFLFISFGRVTYDNFAASAELIVFVYHETAAVYLYLGSGGGGGGERQWVISLQPS